MQLLKFLPSPLPLRTLKCRHIFLILSYALRFDLSWRWGCSCFWFRFPSTYTQIFQVYIFSTFFMLAGWLIFFFFFVLFVVENPPWTIMAETRNSYQYATLKSIYTTKTHVKISLLCGKNEKIKKQAWFIFTLRNEMV